MPWSRPWAGAPRAVHAGWEWCFVAAALTARLGFAVVLRYRGTLTLRVL